MKEPRKIERRRSAPPPGLVYIEDYEAKDGSVLKGIASRLGITPSTYRKWRMAGKGPHTFKAGQKVYARITEIENWISQQERASLPTAA